MFIWTITKILNVMFNDKNMKTPEKTCQEHENPQKTMQNT